MSSNVDFTSVLPKGVPLNIFKQLGDSKFFQAASLVSKTWHKLMQDESIMRAWKESVLNVRIDRWMLYFWGDFSLEEMQHDRLIAGILNETNITEKQKKFSAQLGYCDPRKIHILIAKEDLLFRACLDEYMRLNPSVFNSILLCSPKVLSQTL